jgi:predicted nucleic acid-binding protein
MSDVVLVDASVAVKWVIDEEHTPLAQTLLQDVATAARTISVPPHFMGEVVNSIYQRWRSTDPAKHIDETEARQAIRGFLSVDLQIESPAGLYERAFDLAQAHGLPSIYDALYVALAEMLGGELWTADRRLLQALAGQLAYVRWLGDYHAGDAAT